MTGASDVSGTDSEEADRGDEAGNETSQLYPVHNAYSIACHVYTAHA
jgi:hypothetical protein